jgi:hypothetical protein
LVWYCGVSTGLSAPETSTYTSSSHLLFPFAFWIGIIWEKYRINLLAGDLQIQPTIV